MDAAPVQGDPQPLLARLRAGEPAAFESLVRTEGPRLLAVARRLLHDAQESEDAVQDGFLSAFRRLDRFDGRSTLGTWLHRIVVNACLDRLRRRREDTATIDDLLPRWMPYGHFESPPERWRGDVESPLERAETIGAVREAIDRLPSNYRTALLLREIEGVPSAEAAASLGITEGALKVRVHRARQALRTLLSRTHAID